MSFAYLYANLLIEPSYNLQEYYNFEQTQISLKIEYQSISLLLFKTKKM